MEEEYQYKNGGTEEMRHLEELVAEVSESGISHVFLTADSLESPTEPHCEMQR